jgi:imidazoleglycerol phosphate synthase glutamine amidotransferase subunit HisH
MKKIKICKMGVGNIDSIVSYMKWLGFDVEFSEDLMSEHPLIVAGVASLWQNSYIDKTIKALKIRKEKNYSTLGICAGHQIFFSGTEESQHKYKSIYAASAVKIMPHGKTNIGNHDLKIYGGSLDLGSGYFCHTYGVKASETNFDLYATIELEDIEVMALFVDGPLMGVQFHPEKSKMFNHQLVFNHLNNI